MRIIVFKQDLNGGVAYYRQEIIMQELIKRGHEVVYLDGMQCLPDNVKDTDFILFLSPVGNITLECITLLKITNMQELAMIKQGIPEKYMEEQGLSTKKLNIIIDFDDDLFSIHPYNSAYFNLGRKETVIIQDNKPKVLAQDGKQYKVKRSDGTYGYEVFSTEANKHNVKTQIQMLRLADIVTTPSKRLQKRFKRLAKNGHSYLIPNGLNFDLYPIRTPNKDKIRVLWTLSSSHFQDWSELRESLGGFLKKNSNVTLVTMGVKFGGGNDIPAEQWEHHEWVNDKLEYPKKLAELNCDIGLAYVSKWRYNLFKSPLKWEEYSALNMATVASKCLYDVYLKDGDNVLLGDNPKEIINQLQILVNDKDTLERITSNANRDIKEYDIQKVVDEYEKMLLKAVSDERTKGSH